MNDLELLDWRREVAAVYQAVRAEPDAQRAHEQWRARRDDLFAHHPASPLDEASRRRFRGLVYAPYDVTLRFEVEVDTRVDPVVIEIVTSTDGVLAYRRCGRVELGTLGSLELWWLEGYGGGVFLPIADTSARSYPGGRYVLDTVKGADLGGTVDLRSGTGSLVVDLNFSYNPSCAYDPRWSCPLAPAGNRLERAIEAGEYRFS